MKRFFATLLAALMVISLVSIPVAAEGEVVFTADTVTGVLPGDDVSVPVYIEGENFEAHTLNMYVEYDTAALTLNSITKGDIVSDATMCIPDISSEPGKAKFGFLYVTDGFTQSGTLFTMNFTVNAEATEDVPLHVVVVEFVNLPVNGTATPIPFVTEDGLVDLDVEPVETEAPATEEPVEHTLDEALNVSGGELHFVSEGTYPWIVVEEGDRLFAQSGNGGVSSSSSTLTLTVVCEEGDTLTFEYKAFGEGTNSYWDHCDFYVDSTRVLYYGAQQNDWTVFTTDPLTAGEHTFTWSYTKDSSVNPNGDYFAVDNVELTEGE
ncbi:MAG: hypothetical protein II724_07735, partial [Clostridia bacterium]|nr:hypothetical protein [Clostridia bacterium]